MAMWWEAMLLACAAAGVRAGRPTAADRRPPSAAGRPPNASQPRRLLSGCALVREVHTPPIAALVRGHTYTEKEHSGCSYPGAKCSADALDPICASGASHCGEMECAVGPQNQIEVRFNSRSYVLSEYNGQCRTSSIGDRYTCVDYQKGALFLAGKTLSFTLDLSQAGCGCNAAVYLVAMPQNLNPTACGDYYCDANSVCGVSCAEIDLVEANKVAFVSTVHVGDDKYGENFGIGHVSCACSNTASCPLKGFHCACSCASVCHCSRETMDIQ